jgi:hypothetical protein
MTDALNNLPISIDYTSRDFYALRADLIARVQANLPSWLGTDPADFGVALIEAFAYMGDVANYYIDRVANESYLATATQRSSILGYARSIGYTVNGYRAAKTTLAFGNSNTTTALTIPAGTVVYVDLVINNQIKRIKFTTDNSVTVPANTTLSASPTFSAYTTTATQGSAVANVNTSGAALVDTSLYGVKVSSTTGQANQVYSLNDNNVVDSSLAIYIKDGNTYIKWTKVTDLTLWGKADRVYSTILDENNYINILFGDGVSGAIPTSSNEVWAAYNLGDGVYGNMAASSLNTNISPITYVPGYSDASTFTPYITVTNSTSATGGADPESNASIRYGAFNAAGTVLRAVTLTDYEKIALTTTNIGKVKAYASTYGTVTLYVAPKRDSVLPSDYTFGASDLYPGYTTTNSAMTTEMTTLLTDVSTTVNNYTQIGVTVTTTPVYYTPVTIVYNYTAAPGYSSSDIETAVDSWIISRFSYTNARIADVLTPDAIAKEIISVPGIATASVTTLSRTSAGLATLTGNPGEVFVITASNVTGVNSNTSVLTGLTATYNGSSTASTPSFTSSARAYSFTVGGSAAFTLTPTISSTDITAGTIITINGSIVSSGSALTIPLTVGTNTATITVTNYNFVKTTYSITISRTA